MKETTRQLMDFIGACESAGVTYSKMGGESEKVLAQAYGWMARGAYWALQIIGGNADAETAFNDPIRTCVSGFSQDDSNEVIAMIAQLWNEREDEE